VSRHRLILPGLAVLAYALAFAQRPGKLVADTKVDLYVDPSRFLSHLASAWSSTADLGHVWAGQNAGFLFPMAPWFAAGDALGLPMWVVHRLWLGTLLFAAAWGVVRLLEVVWERDRGVAHTAAAVLFVVNPYVTLAASRMSIALLAYAGLPWLLLSVNRGLRDPRGWRWPAAFALVLTAMGAGVNATLVGWVLVGPLLLVVYDLRWGGVAARALVPYGLRLTGALAVACSWWVVPVIVHATYGTDIAPFTGQRGSIWATTSISESLRLMGFSTSHLGADFGWRPGALTGAGHLFAVSRPVIVAGLLVPALALGGFLWTRRARYGPFFLILTLAGALVHEAGPLVALGLAVLGGGALSAAWARIAELRRRSALAVAAAALTAVAAWPLVTGRALDRQLEFKLPAAWRQLAADLGDRTDGSRALVEPGQLLAFQRWGGTIDNVLPALTDRPVATRFIVPFSDPRSADLQWEVDDLIGHERALPGQLRPLLDLMAVGDLVVSSDDDRRRGGGQGALEATAQLAPLLDGPGRTYGPARRVEPAAGRIATAQPLPQLRRVQLGTDGIVRVLPRGPVTVVDGSAAGIAALASYGDLLGDRPMRYAADLSREELRAAAAAGATIAITDSNRRQDVPHPGRSLSPFDRGSDAQTVLQAGGVLRPPVLAEQALRGADLGKTPLEYLFDRRTAGAPDPEAQLARTIEPPAARHWTAAGWVHVDATASDGTLDRLAGTTGPGSADSSSRFENRPGYRASSAFDGDPATAWVGQWLTGRPASLSWTTRDAVAVRQLRLVPAPFVARVPEQVRLNGAQARVAGDGTVTFASPVRGRRFRLEIVRAAFPGGTPRRLRRRRAVAIGELQGAGLALSVPRAGALKAPCDSAAVSANGAPLAMRVTGDVATLDAGRPLAASGCGGIDLPGSRFEVRGLARALVVDHLRLAAAPPSGIVLPGQGGRVLRQGNGADGRRDNVRVTVDGPSWLVLGESFDKGWRARCNGHDLGAPRPIEGYANGWLIDRGCSRVDFRFAPDNTLRLAYLLSIFGIPFLIVAVARRRRPGYTNLQPLSDPDPVRSYDLVTAAGIGVAVAIAIAFVFAPVAGAVAFPIVAALLWRGARVRRLIEAAIVLLALGAPVAYLLAGWDDRAGRWVAVAAVCLLAIALVRTLDRARAPG
jgi:hypothetical protein